MESRPAERPCAGEALGLSFSRLQFLWGHDLDLFAFDSTALTWHVTPGGYSLPILLCELLISLQICRCSWKLAFPGRLRIFRLEVEVLKAGGQRPVFLQDPSRPSPQSW